MRTAALTLAALSLCACRQAPEKELPPLSDPPVVAPVTHADVSDDSPAYGIIEGHPGSLLVDVGVEADDAARVRPGETAEVEVLPSTHAVRCTVLRVLPSASGETGQALAWLKPASEQGLAPNAFAYARIRMGTRRGVLTVPPQAVIISGGRTVVLKAVTEKGGTRYVVTPVATGAAAHGRVEVRAGLSAGDSVVVQGGIGDAFPDFKAAGD